MPIKFKESMKNRDGSVKNFYMKSTSMDELLSAVENSSTPNKRKQKIRNELKRRALQLLKVTAITYEDNNKR
jgi:hypothetical protein